jgi:hypothetical protein
VSDSLYPSLLALSVSKSAYLLITVLTPHLWLLRFWRHLSVQNICRACCYPSELEGLACRQDAWAVSRLPFAMDFFDLRCPETKGKLRQHP